VVGSARPLVNTSSVPPLLTTVLLAVPPEATSCTPPLNTVAPLAKP
jgi:hypothetical protein